MIRSMTGFGRGEYSDEISKVTVERTLTELVKSGYIVKVGAGPATVYVKV